MNKEETITITMEEYKELLIIKGKYEELKSLYIPQTYPKITYCREFKDNEYRKRHLGLLIRKPQYYGLPMSPQSSYV